MFEQPTNPLVDASDQIVLFKCIVDFVHALRELYGEQQHSLELYALLLEKTGIIHQEPIKKHITLFYEFVFDNQEAILENSETLFNSWTITYSEKVFIDLKQIITTCSVEDKRVIWQHLLTLLAVLIPTSRAKEILQRKKEKATAAREDKSDTFLTDMIEKVGKHIDPSKTSDPTEMMSSIMNSGVFSELVTDMSESMNNGNLDVKKIMGNLQGMLGNISNMMDDSSVQNTPPKLT